MSLFVEVNSVDKGCPVIINLDHIIEIAPLATGGYRGNLTNCGSDRRVHGKCSNRLRYSCKGFALVKCDSAIAIGLHIFYVQSGWSGVCSCRST